MEKLKYTILHILFFSTLSFGGEIRDKAEHLIRQNFGDSCNIDVFKLILDKDLKQKSEIHARQRFFGKFLYYYEVKDSNELIGYALLDNVLGKVKPITFMIICNPDKSIISVEIIKYREQYGGEIENKSWLNQFNNSNLDSKLELGNDVDGISGATISVKSIIKGVKRNLFLINNLGENERDLLTSIK